MGRVAFFAQHHTAVLCENAPNAAPQMLHRHAGRKEHVKQKPHGKRMIIGRRLLGGLLVYERGGDKGQNQNGSHTPAEEVYADNRSTFVEETSLSTTLEGKSRPGHFRGVCTVVAKLFNILAPDGAVFGEKDFQQLAVIRRMVRDLNFNLDIIAVPIVREEDGLACSSRNQYLNSHERKQASVLHKALQAAASSDKKSAKDIIALVQELINEAHLARIDYVAVVDAETLKPVENAGPNTVLLVAVFFGKTRLIDNLRLA